MGAVLHAVLGALHLARRDHDPFILVLGCCWAAVAAYAWLIPTTSVSDLGVRTLRRRVRWADVDTVQPPLLTDGRFGRVRLVLADGREVWLPGVPGDRVPALQRLAATARGRRQRSGP